MTDLEPRQAQRFLQDHPDALFVDCRTDLEYFFVGHPVGALHVAWHEGPDWEVNPRFVDQVRELAGNDVGRPVVLICRSGNRSEEAGRALEAQGLAEIQ